jgi:hypothetical protein
MEFRKCVAKADPGKSLKLYHREACGVRFARGRPACLHVEHNYSGACVVVPLAIVARGMAEVRVLRPAPTALGARHKVSGQVEVRHLPGSIEKNVRAFECRERVRCAVVVLDGMTVWPNASLHT